MIQVPGQISIFDVLPKSRPKRPCEYGFARYIGQRVMGWHGYDGRAITGILKITEIKPYYTIAVDENGEEYALTPTTMKVIDN